MSEAEKFRITDLADPKLLDVQKEALAWAEANPLPAVRIETVLDEARRRTGLSDFGDEGFRARLAAQIDALNADTGISALAYRGCYEEMVTHARNRLQLEDLIRRHPEILDIALEPQVLIAGLPRSGTTFLHNIMAADARFRSTPYYEATRPIAGPWIVDGKDTRWQLAQDSWEAMDRISPFVKMIHPFTPDHISEDVDLIDLDYGTYTLEWKARVPGWRDYMHSHDFRPSFRYFRKVLQALTYQTGGSRKWVTKCPQHMERLEPLHDVFADATFLINHRDPVASIQSAITANAAGARLSRKTVDIAEVADYWIDRYERMLRRCVAQRDTLDEERTLDIYFDELMAAPAAVVARAYAVIGMPFDDAARTAIDEALAHNKRGKYGQLSYDLREDFGIDPAKLRERFGFYFERFPDVRVEVR